MRGLASLLSTRIARWIVLGGLAVAGLALRAPQLDESLWIDELHTAWTVGNRLDAVAARARICNHSPLYFWPLWGWMQWTGFSEAALRWPSLALGILTIFAAGWWVLRVTGQLAAAAFTAALLAVDPHAMYYALEARPYAAVALLGLLLTAYFEQLLVRPLVRLRISYWFGATVLFHLHYTAALVMVSHFAACLYLSAREPQGKHHAPAYRWRHYLWDGLVAAPLILATVPVLRDLAARRGAWTFVHAPDPLRVVTLWPVTWYIAVPLAIWAISWAARAAFGCRVPSRRVEPTRALLVVAFWFTVPLLTAAIATWVSWPIFHRRYLCGTLAAPAILAGLVLARSTTSRAIQWIAAGCVVGVVWFNIGPGHQRQLDGRWVARSRENWRGAMDFVTTQATPQDGIWVDSALVESPHLLGPSSPTTPLTQRQREFLAPAAIVYGRTRGRDPSGTMAIPAEPILLQRNTVWLAKAATTTLESAVGIRYETAWVVARGRSRRRSARTELDVHRDGQRPARATVLECTSFGTIQVMKVRLK